MDDTTVVAGDSLAVSSGVFGLRGSEVATAFVDCEGCSERFPEA